MDDLLSLLRKHDLPPRWDGRAVLWEGWSAGLRGQVFICPPPKSPPCCEGCGSLAEPVSPGASTGLGAWWTLDDTDYGDDGSVD